MEVLRNNGTFFNNLNKKVREEYGVKRISQELIEKVTEVLVGEVKTFDMYLTGELYEEEYE